MGKRMVGVARILPLYALLLAFSAIVASQPAPLSEWIQASETWDPWKNPYGICTHQTTPEALRVIKEAGIGWIRIDMNWRDIEPRERGRFEWGAIDSVVQLARENQLKIYATVGGTPEWAADPNIKPDKDRDTYNVPPAGSGDWMNYLRALVMRYSGDIQTYGLWNEPNHGNWKGSPESYVQLIVNPAAITIKTACPECKVVAGDLFHSETSCRFEAAEDSKRGPLAPAKAPMPGGQPCARHQGKNVWL